MNAGLFGAQYGAPLTAVRMRVKLGQGASQVMFDTLVLVTTDNTTPTSKSSGATVGADVTDLVIAVPVSVGRSGQSVTAAGSLALQVADGTVTGGNRRGNGAIDLQTTRSAATQVANGLRAFLGPYGGGTASGQASVCMGSGVASGANSVTFQGASASGVNAFGACGSANTTGNNAAGFGDAVTVSATRGFAAGNDLAISGQGSSGFGQGGTDRGIVSTQLFAPGPRVAAGDRQLRKLPQCAVTTNATATVLTTNAAAEAASNTWVIPNNYGAVFTGWILARNTANNDQRAWRFEGMVTRDATAATVALLGAVTPVAVGTADAGLSACVLAVGVNTTNGSLIVTATGIAATTIHWAGWIDGAENG
jgi:hypothetical protein